MSTLAQLQTNCPTLEVLIEGYTLGANSKGYTGTMRVWIAASDLDQLILTVGGLSEDLTIGGNSVSRLIPLIHPYLDASWNCYADDLHIYTPPEAVATTDGEGGGIAFEDYFADIHFSTPEYYLEIGDYPCTKISFSQSEERVTRPGSSYKFPSDGLRLNHDVGVRVPSVDFTITNYRLAALDADLYQSLIGTTNYTTFYGNPPGTVIYKGPMNDGQEMIAGQLSFTVTHGFNYRSIPHDEIMRPDGTGFEAPIEENYGGDDGTPDETNEEDLTDPIYLLPEGEHNQLWGY